MKRRKKRPPLFAGLGTAIVWVAVYLFLERLHGMGLMFRREFPLLIATVQGIHPAEHSAVTGIFFAFVDGAVLGTVAGWLASRILAR